jgi:hypothetical protein
MFGALSSSQRLPFASHRPLLIFSILYGISVILFFSAFGVGINPLEAVIKLQKGPTTTPTEPTEPLYYDPNSPSTSPTATQQSALKSLGITFGILWWIIGMGAPAVGVLSFIGIWIGVNEKQFTFVRVVRAAFTLHLELLLL